MYRSHAVYGPPVLAVCALLLIANAASAQDLSLAFQSGRVTLVARDVTVPRILDQWARIGGTIIVNGEAIQGGPVTLQLIDVLEREVVDILLRGVGGYVVAGRADALAGASTLGRILILPTRPAPARNAFVPPNVPAPVVAVKRPEIADEQSTSARVPPAAPFVHAASDALDPSASPSAAGVFVGQGTIPTRPATAFGSAKPGEATAEPPPLFQPTSTPTKRPGETPPAMPVTRQSPGPPRQQ